jgi:hypothetical protein
MDLEIIKTKFLKIERLTHEEVLIIFDDMMETVLRNGKFDDKPNTFYTLNNYKLILTAILENNIEVPPDLDLEVKLDALDRISKKQSIKKAQKLIYVGVFIIAFSIIYYFLTDKQLLRYCIGFLMLGLLLLLSGVDKLKNLT